MGVLSNRQFQLKVRAGGASRDVNTKEEAPASGGYVSTPAGESRMRGRVTAGVVGRHLDRISGNGGYQGGWPAKEGGNRVTYLDHSRRVLSAGLAVGLGHAYGQESVYLPNRANPYPKTKELTGEAADYIRNARVNGSNYPKPKRP